MLAILRELAQGNMGEMIFSFDRVLLSLYFFFFTIRTHTRIRRLYEKTFLMSTYSNSRAIYFYSASNRAHNIRVKFALILELICFYIRYIGIKSK